MPPLRHLSEVQDELPRIVARYRAGEKATLLAREFGIHQSSLSRYLARSGAPSPATFEAQTREVHRATIVAMYRDGQQFAAITEATSLSTHLIKEYLKFYGEPVRPRGISKALRLPDHVLTKEWALSEAGAWVCGLIVTDGSFRVNQRPAAGKDASPTLRIVLQDKDRDGVVKAAEAFGLSASNVKSVSYKTPTGERKQDGACFEFTHPKLWFLHRTLGMPLGDKTTIARLPEILVNNRHAWRGVLDGDGWASVRPAKIGLPGTIVGLVGASLELREQFISYAASQGMQALATDRAPVPHRRAKVMSYYATVSAEPAARLADLLYSDCTYTIPRKRERAFAVRTARLGLPGASPDKARVTEVEAQKWLVAYQSGMTARQIAATTTRAEATIRAHLIRLGADI